jgi:DNA ligase (NAD+)
MKQTTGTSVAAGGQTPLPLACPRPLQEQDMSDIEELRNTLRRHDYLYYVLAEPEISDYDYDMLFKGLEKWEQEYPDLVTLDSPTQCVGGMSAKIYMKANNIS